MKLAAREIVMRWAKFHDVQKKRERMRIGHLLTPLTTTAC